MLGVERAEAVLPFVTPPAPCAPGIDPEFVTHALVHRVLFDGKRATGTEFSREGPGGSVERAEAAREVILSAGAIGSPHTSQLSGVGDPEHLAKIGIPVVHELRGVGKNMQDHYVARVSYPVVGAQTANKRPRGLPLAGEVCAGCSPAKAC